MKVLKEIEEKITSPFSGSSKVWIYQADRIIKNNEAISIQTLADKFNSQWNSHGASLTSQVLIINNLFLVFIVDETRGGASGCSVDKSVGFVKELTKGYGIDFLERMNFAYISKDNSIEIDKLQTLKTLIESGDLTDDTLVFDNMVNNLNDLKSNFVKPIKDSWHKRMI